MEKISLPDTKEEKIDNFSSKFTIEPLFPGFGQTIGNSIRRVLLSSILGSAITSYKVDGVNHEFSSIPHIKEDMIEILLNLKSVNVKSFSEDVQILKISKNGPCKVTAFDFSKNSEVEIINSDQIIATLDNKAKFNLEVTVEKGIGFRSTDDSDYRNKEIGRMAIDSNFSPIEIVKIDVENTRVGQITNYDKLMIEVKTDGSVKPKQAMIDASNILIDHYKSFSFGKEEEGKLTKIIKEDEISDNIDQDKTEIGVDPKTKIEDASFSARTTNALLNSGIKTLAGLKKLSNLKLMEVKGLGQKGIEEISNKFSKNEFEKDI